MKIYCKPTTEHVSLVCDVRMGIVDGVSGGDPTETGPEGGGTGTIEAPRRL